MICGGNGDVVCVQRWKEEGSKWGRERGRQRREKEGEEEVGDEVDKNDRGLSL